MSTNTEPTLSAEPKLKCKLLIISTLKKLKLKAFISEFITKDLLYKLQHRKRC